MVRFLKIPFVLSFPESTFEDSLFYNIHYYFLPQKMEELLEVSNETTVLVNIHHVTNSHDFSGSTSFIFEGSQMHKRSWQAKEDQCESNV